MPIPQTKAVILKSKKEVTLPDFLTGQKMTLLISFEKEHFPQIDSWMKDAHKNGENVYHLAVISNRFMLMQDMFLDGLAEYFPDSTIQDKTLISFTYLEKFCAALEIGGTDTPVKKTF